MGKGGGGGVSAHSTPAMVEIHRVSLGMELRGGVASRLHKEPVLLNQ